VLAWPQYAYTTVLNRHPAWQLYNASGDVIRLHGDPSFPQPADGMLVVDFTNASAAALWWQACYNMTLSGAVDGCFADRADNTTILPGNRLTPNKEATWLPAKIQTLQTLNTALGGEAVVVANHDWYPGVTATMLESYAATASWVAMHQAAVAAGKLVQVRGGRGDKWTRPRRQMARSQRGVPVVVATD